MTYSCNKSILVCAVSALLIASLAHQAVAKACYGIAFQDGSDFTAYEAGAFQGLMEQLTPDQRAYDVVNGVGFGAVNAAVLSQYAAGKELDAAKKMVDLWTHLDHSDVYRNYVGGITQAFLYEPALFSTVPWRVYLQQHFLDAHKRLIDVGATDVNRAQFVRFNESVTGSAWVDALMATTAEPVLFPYQNVQGEPLITGAYIFSLDVGRVIQRCQALGASDADIHIDVILTARKDFGAWSGREKTLDAFSRTIKMLEYITGFRDYTEAREAYPNVNFRYAISPSQTLPNPTYPFAFKQSDLQAMVNTGLQDGRNAKPVSSNAAADAIVREHYAYLLRDYLGVDSMDAVTDEMIAAYRKIVRQHVEEYWSEKAAAKQSLQ